MISSATKNHSKTSSGNACFAAGTLVHTQEGLKPIEKIEIGDWVLSQPEETGEKAYKRVVRTTHFEDKAVLRVMCDKLVHGCYESHSFIVTGNHPFYVVGHNTEDIGGRAEKDLNKPKGWLSADLLEYGAHLLLANGELLRVVAVDPIWRTHTEGMGWIQANRWAEEGYLIDLREGEIKEALPGDETVADFLLVDGFSDRYDDDELTDKWAYKCAVYDIEVEDFHTYYVGELGVWVHDCQ